MFGKMQEPHPGGQRLSDPESPTYFEEIEPDDIVIVRDFQSMEEAGSEGVDYRVQAKRIFAIPDGRSGQIAARFAVYNLESEQGDDVLVVALGVDEPDIRIYFVPEEFPSGTRLDFVSEGFLGFFAEPEDPDRFELTDLEYAEEPAMPPMIIAEEEREVSFRPAGFRRPVFGHYVGERPVPVIWMEYGTDDPDVPNPLILLREENWVDEQGRQAQDGGYITIMLGTRIARSEIQVLPGEPGSSR